MRIRYPLDVCCARELSTYHVMDSLRPMMCHSAGDEGNSLGHRGVTCQISQEEKSSPLITSRITGVLIQ